MDFFQSTFYMLPRAQPVKRSYYPFGIPNIVFVIVYEESKDLTDSTCLLCTNGRIFLQERMKRHVSYESSWLVLMHRGVWCIRTLSKPVRSMAVSKHHLIFSLGSPSNLIVCLICSSAYWCSHPQNWQLGFSSSFPVRMLSVFKSKAQRWFLWIQHRLFIHAKVLLLDMFDDEKMLPMLWSFYKASFLSTIVLKGQSYRTQCRKGCPLWTSEMHQRGRILHKPGWATSQPRLTLSRSLMSFRSYMTQTHGSKTIHRIGVRTSNPRFHRIGMEWHGVMPD